MQNTGPPSAIAHANTRRLRLVSRSLLAVSTSLGQKKRHGVARAATARRPVTAMSAQSGRKPRKPKASWDSSTTTTSFRRIVATRFARPTRGACSTVRSLFPRHGARLRCVPKLVDTTIRLLGQEPLAGRVPTVDLLQLAEILDGAGFAYLEVSGGGVFDTAVRRGVESPWERIRALNARTKTPLAMALRGRFLGGSHPGGGGFVRRFVASAAESGIEVFRLHDPLNDVENLREAGEAITAAGKEFDAGLVFGSSYTGELEPLVEKAKKLPELGASRVLVHDPSGSLRPQRAHDLATALGEASGLPVGLYCQGAAGNAMASGLEAARGGADLIACAVYPVALSIHRVSGEAIAAALAGLGLDTGVDIDALWRASELVDEHIGDEPVTPLAPRIAVRAAEHRLPSGLVAALDSQLRTYAAGDRLDEVLDELARIREEVGWPPLAAPIGQIVRSPGPVPRPSAPRAHRPDRRLAGAAARPLGDPLPDRHRRAPRPDRRPLRQPARADRPDRAPRGRAGGRERTAGGGARGARRAA